MPNLYLVTTPNGASITVAETVEAAQKKVADKQGVPVEATHGRVFSEIEAVE